MKKIICEFKKHNFNYVYTTLNKKEYNYTLDNLTKDFSSVSSSSKYCYLIYLLAKEYTPHNIILICDFLTFTDTFFFDIHPVIYMFINQALQAFPSNKYIIDWVIFNYENHPDSPFSIDEINKLSEIIN
ncbi:MAG: hypothetical protein NC320_09285 [Clostridium sp.]|nr:hypothetical protein [Clostridium sp.]